MGPAAALLLAACCTAAPAGAAPSLSAGSSEEHYSFAGPGSLRWAEGAVPSGPWTALGRVERLRRFGLNDVSGALGLAWKGRGHGTSLWAGGTPDADVLPRGFVSLAWDQALARGLYAEVSARAADYVPAKVYTGSLALFWQALPRLELSARAGESRTQFRRASDKDYPGFLARARAEAAEGGLWTSASYGWYKEAFESGAPGVLGTGTGAFTAGVYGLELGLKPLPPLALRAGFEYEDRDNGTFARRWNLGATYTF